VVESKNFNRFLRALQTLAELGPELTAERSFSDTARGMLSMLAQAIGAREAALFVYNDRPAALTSVAAHGYVLFPETAVIPLLPKHVHALNHTRAPQVLTQKAAENYMSSNGNIAPELFKCIAPLRVGAKFVGLLALGKRENDAIYDTEEIEMVGLLANYVALAVQNYSLTQSLEQRITENLRLLASLHSYYDHTLEAFAGAIDVKDFHTRGHSLRVGRYAAGIGEAMGMEQTEVAGLRAAGYLHDVGKVAVDKRLFAKPSALDAQEFREVADHTVVGHQIVNGVQFPWPQIPEVVRSHHERADGSGYPDHLRNDDISSPVRIVALADTFDAMTSPRPYRKSMGVGEALSEIVRIAPDKFDVQVVQAFLIQVRRDAVGRNNGKTRFLDESLLCNIAATDVDQLAALLNHRTTRMRVYSA
jgi:putative nucleotidyltransferase with HDIG domain